MVSNVGAAPEAKTQADDDEPSMDEIMASIRQIIAEDEQANGPEAPQFPEAVSNTNDPEPSASVDDSALIAAMEREMEAAVAAEAVQEAPVQSLEPAPAVEPAPIPVAASIHERAEQVRGEIGLSTRDGNGLTLEQRLERYRVRGKQQDELRKAKEAEESENRKAETAAMERIAAALPASATQLTPQAVAKALMDETAHGLSEDVKEMVRPVVRQWLDDNLSQLVERLVREEIERVSRRRGPGEI